MFETTSNGQVSISTSNHQASADASYLPEYKTSNFNDSSSEEPEGHLINAQKLNTFCTYTFLEIEGYEVGHLL
jgi:hypothetical protein